jgi:hypothetical protein
MNLRHTRPVAGQVALCLATALVLVGGCSDDAQTTNTTGSGNGGSAGVSVAGSGGQGGASGGNGGGSVEDASAGVDSSDSGDTSVDSSVDAVASDADMGTSNADSAASDADSSASDAASDASADAGASKCSTPCSGATPLCDDASGTCKAIEVLAFYTVYEQMADLAHRSFSREANAWFPTVARANGFTFESTTNWTRLSGVTAAKGRVVMFFDNVPSVDQVASFKSYIDHDGLSSRLVFP